MPAIDRRQFLRSLAAIAISLPGVSQNVRLLQVLPPESSLLDDILANPDDDAPRLRYAEHLLRQGNSLGELIRLQCAEARYDDTHAEWFTAKFKASNLLHGADRFFSHETSNYAEWESDLGEITKGEAVPCGTGWFQRGMLEKFTIYDCMRFAEIEEQLFAAAPLLRELVIFKLDDTTTLQALHRCQRLDRIRRLEISHSALDAPAMDVLTKCEGLRNLKHLELKSCKLSAQSLNLLAQTNVLQNLQSLDYATCTIEHSSSTEPDFKPLFAPEAFPFLKSLSLGRNHSPGCLSTIFRWIRNRELTQLMMRDLNADEWTELLTLLPYAEDLTLYRSEGSCDFSACPHLRKLSLWNARLDADSMRDFARTISPGLVRLELHDNQIGDEGVACLMNCPALSTLKYLHLGQNPYGKAGAQAIAESPYLKHLVALKLNNVPIGDDGIASLVASPNLSQLRFLDLWNTGCTDAGAEAIAASPHLANLNWLNLDENQFGPVGGRSLATSPYLNRITAFRNDNQVGREVQQELNDRFGYEAMNSYFRGYLI